jgi:glucosamine--fructose-6-phosphate aminotransferase (isomerizing)
VAVVHRGIIESFQAPRAELEAGEHISATQTDAEVVPHMIEELMRQRLPPETATMEALQRLEGAFAVVLLFQGEEDMLVAARRQTSRHRLR